MYEAGIYKPYDDKHLFEIIKEFKIKMKVFKILGLIIFAVVLIIFTVGYASQPVVQIPNADKSVNQDFIIGNINDLISGNVGNIYNVVFFMCVGSKSAPSIEGFLA